MAQCSRNLTRLRCAEAGSHEDLHLLCPPAPTKKHKARGRRGDGSPKPALLSSFSLELSGAREMDVLWSNGGGGRRKKTGRCRVLMASLSAPRPVSSLSFSTIVFFFFVNFHFAGAMILSRSFWGSLGGRRLVSGKRHGRLDLPLVPLSSVY